MWPGGSRTISMIYHMIPGLDPHSVRTDPAQHLITEYTGSAVDYLYDLYNLYDIYDRYDLYNLYDLYHMYDLYHLYNLHDLYDLFYGCYI